MTSDQRPATRRLELAIESASDDTGVALSVNGAVSAVATWTTQQNHSVELLPNVDRLLTEAGRSKTDLSAIFVDIGPGGYAALRVGMSIAKALAHALKVPLAGIGRLELDAYRVAREARERRVFAVHRAGRGEVAWAAYHADGGDVREELAPRISKPDELLDALGAGDVATGDIDDALANAIVDRSAALASPREHRVMALAALGHQRLAVGRADDPTALVPLYLRVPSSGPQTTRS